MRDTVSRGNDGQETTALGRYAIDSAVVQRMKPDALILHPLPRTVELDKSVDADPRAMYFRQAMNGLYVRMALLTMLLEKEPAAGSAWW
jgi:aspartate carbamoyltransferase catalytic subunit